jgi:hypothetical protein
MKRTENKERAIEPREVGEQVKTCYLPILKAKRGELKALSMLKNETKEAICPIIELVAGCKDNVAKYLRENWAFGGASVYIDPYILLNETHGDFNEVEEIFSILWDEDINAIPVIRVDYSDKILDAFKSIVTKGVPISLRVTREFAIPIYFDVSVERIKTLFEIHSDSINLIIDYSFVDRDTVTSTADSAITLINHISSENFLSVTIAAGSFVKDLSHIAPDTVVNLTRWEWNLRAQLQLALKIEDSVRYSDYATRYPIYEYDAQPYAGSSSIRYTTETGFLILRGLLPSIHPDGMGQYHSKCSLLIRNPHYDGAAFSSPDACIENCANKLITSGNPEVWVKISTARHIEKMVHLLT